MWSPPAAQDTAAGAWMAIRAIPTSPTDAKVNTTLVAVYSLSSQPISRNIVNYKYPCTSDIDECLDNAKYPCAGICENWPGPKYLGFREHRASSSSVGK